MELLILAQEHGGEGTLWDPTILGILVTVAAVALFCGSAYALLATNLGARLGFLVAFTGLCGFLVLLSLLWISTASPLNTLRGKIPAWEVQEVVASPEEASDEMVQTIETDGEEADLSQVAEIRAAVDTALVTVESTPTEPVEPEVNEFAEFAEVSDFTVTQTLVVGGSDPNPLRLEFTHTPQFAVAQFCEVTEPDVPFGEAPPPPECDPASENAGFMVLERNLGSLRLPPTAALGIFSVLFVLGLLSLHWREKDEMELEAARQRPTAVPDTTEDREPEPAGT